MKRLFLFTLLMVSLSAFAVDRSTTERYRFAQANPCPADGQKKYVKCAGFQIDHPTPICSGGVDKASNMRWTKTDVKHSKDAIERAVCACVKKHGEKACPKVDWK